MKYLMHARVTSQRLSPRLPPPPPGWAGRCRLSGSAPTRVVQQTRWREAESGPRPETTVVLWPVLWVLLSIPAEPVSRYFQAEMPCRGPPPVPLPLT